MQLRISISSPLHTYLKQQAEHYGLTMADYVKNLIIQDMKIHDAPQHHGPIVINTTVKKKHSWKKYDLLDG